MARIYWPFILNGLGRSFDAARFGFWPESCPTALRPVAEIFPLEKSQMLIYLESGLKWDRRC